MSCAFVRCCCTMPLACSSDERTVALGEFFAASCKLAQDLLMAFDRFVDEGLVPVGALGLADEILDLVRVVIHEIVASPADVSAVCSTSCKLLSCSASSFWWSVTSMCANDLTAGFVAIFSPSLPSAISPRFATVVKPRTLASAHLPARSAAVRRADGHGAACRRGRRRCRRSSCRVEAYSLPFLQAPSAAASAPAMIPTCRSDGSLIQCDASVGYATECTSCAASSTRPPETPRAGSCPIELCHVRERSAERR